MAQISLMMYMYRRSPNDWYYKRLTKVKRTIFAQENQYRNVLLTVADFSVSIYLQQIKIYLRPNMHITIRNNCNLWNQPKFACIKKIEQEDTIS